MLYDNGAMLIGNLDLVIDYIKKGILENEDMCVCDIEELLKDLENLQNRCVDIVIVNYDNGMSYSLDWFYASDKVKEI